MPGLSLSYSCQMRILKRYPTSLDVLLQITPPSATRLTMQK